MSNNNHHHDEPKEWTVDGFIDYFLDVTQKMKGRSFAFVLGAGASVSSGIPSGSALVNRWLEEIKLRDAGGKDKTLEEWATADALGIRNFSYERRAEFYPDIYHKRFGDDPEIGQADLEDVMKNAYPGLGYSMLAQILSMTRHKIVITTNFDNLVADSVLIFTNTFAQVIGHESLTGYMPTRPGRPLVAKIHRDLLLGPQNSPDEINALHKDWKNALGELFSRYTPVFIGYGGNDGSLMGFLELLDSGTIPGGIFWLYRKGGSKPNKRIRQLVAKHAGKLVPIVDFDVFMVQLAEPLEFGLLDSEVEKGATIRAKRLRDEWEKVKKSLADKPEDAAFEKVQARRIEEINDWWSWELEAEKESDLAKREEIYRQGLKELPNSAELTNNFAYFLHEERRDYDEAERLYRKALALDSSDALYTANFALFLHDIRKDYDEAERLYRRALKLDPSDVDHTFNFALFLHYVRKDYDEAERLYGKALKLDPNHAENIGNFGIFMKNARDDYDEAERLYRRALELDPKNATITNNLANFMKDIRKDYDEAERLLRRSLELDPDHAYAVTNFMELRIMQDRIPEAKTLSDRAWKMVQNDLSQLSAAVILSRGLILQIESADDTDALGRFMTLLQTGFDRTPGSFDAVLAAVDNMLRNDDKKLYAALVDSKADAAKDAALDEFTRWKAIDPIPLDKPWAPLGE